MNNRLGGVRVSAILIPVMIILLLAVGFGVYSQKNGFKQGATEFGSAEMPVSLHHKISPVPQPIVETDDPSILSTPEDQTTTAESETQTDAMPDGPSILDAASAVGAVEKSGIGTVAIEPLEPVPVSESRVDQDTAAGARQTDDETATQGLNTGQSETTPVEQAETPASVEQKAPSESASTSPSEPDATAQTIAATRPSTPKDASVSEGQTLPEPDLTDKIAVSNPFYTIQVGAYRSLANAEQTVARMQRAGYDAYVVETDDPSVRSWYLVRFGRFDRAGPAREQLNAYNQEHQAQAILARSDRF